MTSNILNRYINEFGLIGIYEKLYLSYFFLIFSFSDIKKLEYSKLSNIVHN